MIDFSYILENPGEYECLFEPSPGKFPYENYRLRNTGTQIEYKFSNKWRILPLQNLNRWKTWKEYSNTDGKTVPLTYKQIESYGKIDLYTYNV